MPPTVLEEEKNYPIKHLVKSRKNVGYWEKWERSVQLLSFGIKKEHSESALLQDLVKLYPEKYQLMIGSYIVCIIFIKKETGWGHEKLYGHKSSGCKEFIISSGHQVKVFKLALACWFIVIFTGWDVELMVIFMFQWQSTIDWNLEIKS